jgi:bifunctional N-acetylglucosamine-1-phosphate-uridyltransferase/glucosamine-1-phosphate-acetyltransferase GlmU-like protein
LLISSCDYTFVYDEKRLYNIINILDPDVIIWTFKEYPDPRLAPFSYAYVKTLNGKVIAVSEKRPISKNPHKDEIVQGIFYFKSKKIFMAATKYMFKNRITVNNEYYVGNSINYLIKENYNVVTFQVDQYICLGTPHDINVYKFWEQEFV